MAVLVEAISIIILINAINEKYIGGWGGFLADIPNKTLCNDEEVVRVGFMHGKEASLYVDILESKGLRFVDGEHYIDFAVVDQKQGMKLKCEWLEVNYITFLETGVEIRKCGLKGSTITNIYMPDGWEYEGSLSQKCSYRPPGL